VHRQVVNAEGKPGWRPRVMTSWPVRSFRRLHIATQRTIVVRVVRSVRICKVKGFARFQRRERIADAALVGAVRSAEAGLVDADLGVGLIKQRVAGGGQGKSGGFRTIIAYRRGNRAIFLLGFAKNERDNVEDDEIDELKGLARRFLGLTADQIAALTVGRELTEVTYDEET
jgi:hypothetical protein